VRFPKPNGLNQKKGISSIVGGIFFLVLMTSGFTVYYVALDSQAQMLHTQQIIADYEVAKIREKFVVAASSSGVNNLLSLQVVNTGNTVVEIADIWIVNKTAVTQNATKYDVDYRDASIPVGYSGNILANTPLYLISDIYDIKVISSLGTIQAVEYDVAGGSNILSAQMVAIPQDVRFGENVTVILMVTNTGDFDIDQVQANLPLEVNPNQCQATPNLIFGGPTNLAPSQSTMFFWDCILDPPIGNVITLTGNATGLLSGVPVDSNDASDSIIVRDFTAGGDGDEIILKDELFGRPEIFMIIPNTFGDAGTKTERGIWGINIVNPTNKTMTVSKLSISALRANANDNHVIFAVNCQITPNPGHLEPIFPATGWSCPNENVLTWKNIASPLTINRQSAVSFLAKIHPHSLTGSAPGLETIVTTVTATTSLGAFGKGPYETSMKKTDEAIANVYFSNPGGSTTNSDIQGVIMGIQSGQTLQYNVTMAEFTTSGSQAIAQFSDLIINIPKEWDYQDDAAGFGFTIIDETTFPDDSTQIVGELDANLSNGGQYITFSMKAPFNTGSNAKMYVFHILGSGTTINAPIYSIGPISETIIQVCPTSGGPPGCP